MSFLDLPRAEIYTVFDNVLYSPRVIITPVRRHDHSVTERDVATSERPSEAKPELKPAALSVCSTTAAALW